MWWQKLHLSQKFSIFMGMFLLGVASGRLGVLPTRWLGYFIIIAVLLVVLWGKKSLWVLMVFVVFLLSNVYFQWRGRSDLSFYYDKKVSIHGLIIKDVENNGLEQKIILRLEKVCLPSGQCQFSKQRILISLPLYPQYEYGQKLKLEGKLTWPDGNYAHYLRSQGIFALVYNPKNVTPLASDHGNFFWQKLYQVKYFILRQLNDLLPAPHSSFLAALLLGIRQGMPSSVNDDFRNAGISHIVAVSGYNISLLANFSLLVLPYFYIKRRSAIVFSVGLIVIFVLLTGASASVVRAGVMGVLLLLARLWERPSQIFNVLLLTACLMTLYQPGVLLGDLGFQLSFLATIALIYFLPLLKKASPFYREDSWWQENFFTTLAATIATLPLILYNFGIFSVLAIPVNLLVLPFIPYLMTLGFGAFIISLFSLSLAKILALVLFGLLQAILSLARIVSSWQWSVWEISNYSLTAMFLFYLIFFIMIIRFHLPIKKHEKFLQTNT